MSTFLCKQPSSCDWCLEIDGPSSFSSVTSTSSDGPWLWGIWCVHVLLLYALCCTDPWLMLMQDFVYYMLSWFLAWFDVESSMWCTGGNNSSCYALRSLVVCCWDTLVFAMHVSFWHRFCAMLVGCSSCMFLYHTDRSLLIESSSCVTSLIATPAWGNFSLYDRNIVSCVHHHYWQHLM